MNTGTSLSLPEFPSLVGTVVGSNKGHSSGMDSDDPRQPSLSLLQASSSAENLEIKINSDYVSILLYCHNPSNNTTEYFLESGHLGLTLLGSQRVGPGETWRSSVEKFLGNIEANKTVIEGIVRLDRWYVPGSEKMASHAIHSVSVRSEFKELYSKRFKGNWVKISELMTFHLERKLISMDLMDMIIRFELPVKPSAVGIELPFSEVFMGLDLLKSKGSGLELIVRAAALGRNEQEQLYKEFLNITLPFLSMGVRGFSLFLKDIGWDETDFTHLFRTFDMENKGGITFRNFLCGIAVIEPGMTLLQLRYAEIDVIVPGTQHGGPPAEVRCRYIFRFFDKNNDGRLSFIEFRDMVAAIRRSKGLPNDAKSIQADAEKTAVVFGETITDTLGQTEFLSAVGQLKFRGTSHLLRSPKSISTYLQEKQGQDSPMKVHTKRSRSEIEKLSHTLIEEMGGFMHTDDLPPDWKAYDVATHCVRVKKSGTIMDIHSLWDIKDSGLGPDQEGKKLLIGGGASRIKSVENFNQQSQPNEMLNGLKYFESLQSGDSTKGLLPKPSFEWGEVDKGSLAKCLIKLCHQVKKILSSESRLIELSSPVYILGDIHGNFPDLMCFEKALWRLGPVLTPASFLFLGDYVDRGIYSVEVIAYLFAQKISAPSKWYLLRGNHEIREVQQMFSFYNECIAKFGDKLGQDIWSAVNEAFDCMPLAAVIDKKIFCAHGGIPPPWIGHGMVSLINDIPVPLPRPEEQSKLSWELMWSDPVHVEQMTQEQNAQLTFVEGFGENTRRGTGHVFSSEALDAFLDRNHFSHVVRAHEVQQAGFKVQLGGKLLTVFSSSKYCGGSNEAACILADKYKLRTIRLDTT